MLQLTICYHDVKAALALAPDIPEGRSLLMELEGSAEQARRLALSRAVAGNLQEALQKINTALENNPEEVQYYLFRYTSTITRAVNSTGCREERSTTLHCDSNPLVPVDREVFGIRTS